MIGTVLTGAAIATKTVLTGALVTEGIGLSMLTTAGLMGIKIEREKMERRIQDARLEARINSFLNSVKEENWKDIIEEGGTTNE